MHWIVVKHVIWIQVKDILRTKWGENEGWKWAVENASQWEFHSLYHSLHTVRANKSRKFRCVVHITKMKQNRSAFKILTDKSTGKRSLGMNTLEWILRKWVSYQEWDWFGSGYGVIAEKLWIQHWTSGFMELVLIVFIWEILIFKKMVLFIKNKMNNTVFIYMKLGKFLLWDSFYQHCFTGISVHILF